MKRTNIYWILLFGLLAAISWLYASINDYNEPILREVRSNLYEAAYVGDFYLKKDSLGEIQRFFKVAETTKYGRAVHIAEGNLACKNNFLKEAEIRKGIERSMYFDSELKKVPKEYLVNLEADSNNYTIHRLSYPPEEVPLAFKILYSPLFIIICIGLIFLFIRFGRYINIYLNSRHKWLVQGVIFVLLSTLILSVISLFQLQISYGFKKNAHMVMTINYSLSLLLRSSVIALIALPFFFLFRFIKTKYLKSYSFADQEFLKFSFLVVGGSLYLLILMLGVYFLIKQQADEMQLSQIEIPQYLQMSISLGLIACSIIAIANFLNNLQKQVQNLRLKEGLLNQSDKRALSAQAALDSLQAKVNPHFLYNSLNSIASLAQTNPAKTEEMALALSDFYKHSTNRQNAHLSTLGLELKQLQTYLNIEKIRFEERLQYQLDIAENALNTQIPRFLLQPLVENAIKYGFDKTTDKIEITIKGEIINTQLHLHIMDSGEPFAGQMNTGYVLRSIKKKLKLLYPNAHEIHFLNKPVKQVHIILDITKNQLYA